MIRFSLNSSRSVIVPDSAGLFTISLIELSCRRFMKTSVLNVFPAGRCPNQMLNMKPSGRRNADEEAWERPNAIAFICYSTLFTLPWSQTVGNVSGVRTDSQGISGDVKKCTVYTDVFFLFPLIDEELKYDTRPVTQRLMLDKKLSQSKCFKIHHFNCLNFLFDLKHWTFHTKFNGILFNPFKSWLLNPD